MGIFKTNDATQFDDIDGIIIDETTPPSQITGVSANVGILIGQFQRGPSTLSLPISSLGEFHEVYGRSSYLGNIQLRNKGFGKLRIIRVEASDAAKATLSVDGKLTMTAKYSGKYGNNISVLVEDGTNVGKKYTIVDGNSKSVLLPEVYDDVEIASIEASTFGNSNLVSVVVDDDSAEPADLLATPLAGGSDGSVGDTDYEAAMVKAEVERAGNVLFLDEYNSTRNTLLATHAALTNDKMVITASGVDDDRAEAITEAKTLANPDGRVIHAWPYVETLVDGVLQYTSPAAWVASVYTQVAPQIALSYTKNTRYLAGMTGLRYETGRNGHISLDEGGVMAFERDPDVGFLIKNAVTTQRSNTARRDILSRRMADFLQDSIALALKNWQNDVNSAGKADEIKAAITDFDTRLVRDGILPSEQDVKSGSPVLIDTKSLNTDSSIALGLFKILYKRRIYSSMRYIVLQAEIGTNVVVTEA